MTRKEFNEVVDGLGRMTGSPCPENFKVLIWAGYQHHAVEDFKVVIAEGLFDIKNNNRDHLKHANS